MKDFQRVVVVHDGEELEIQRLINVLADQRYNKYVRASMPMSVFDVLAK